MPGVFPSVDEKCFARSSISAEVLEKMIARIGMLGVVPGVDGRCFAYCYFVIAFYYFAVTFDLMKLLSPC